MVYVITTVIPFGDVIVVIPLVIPSAIPLGPTRGVFLALQVFLQRPTTKLLTAATPSSQFCRSVLPDAFLGLKP